MPAVSSDIITRYKEFWDGTNTAPLICATYCKNLGDKTKAPLKPWMENDTGWVFARAAVRAYETGDMAAVDEALDVMEYELENTGYAGCAYPCVNLNTGAGCVAAFITEYARYYSGTVWFELDTPWDYEKIIALPENLTTRYAETQLAAAGMAAKRFGGGAVLTTLDLGGLADVLSSLRRTERFFYDLADHPGEVKAALITLRKIWKNFHDRMTAIIEPANEGLYASWTRTLSDVLYYPSQCDACAMVSPEAFDEFIWPTLSEEMSAYKKTLYHLDGYGEAVHLDTLCANPALRVIQWVPEPAVNHGDARYCPVYEKIISHGRRIVFNGFKGGTADLAALFTRFPKEAFAIFLDAPNYDAAMRKVELILE